VWRRQLAQNGALLSTLSRLFVATVHSFCAKRAAAAGGVSVSAANSGAVTVLQRTSLDLRLNPHLHVVLPDGAYYGQALELTWEALRHLQTRGPILAGECLCRWACSERPTQHHLKRVKSP
jgi:hypothetical protein